MCGKGKGQQSNTSQNQNVQYTPYGIQNLQNIYDAAANASSQPYRPYEGQLTAGLNPYQTGAMQKIASAGNTAQPYLNQGTNYMNQSAAIDKDATKAVGHQLRQDSAPISGQDIGRYMSPFTNRVVDTTLANIQQNDTQQQQQLMGNAAMRGSLGGDRSAVMQAELARNQDLATNQTIAGLRNQGYSQATNTAMAEQQARMSGDYQRGALYQSGAAQLAGIGQGMFGSGLSAEQAQLGQGQNQLAAGTQEQQTKQAELTGQYQQYQQMMAYPYQQAQFLASIGLPATAAMGGWQSQIGETNQVITPPWWNFQKGGAVPQYKKGGPVEDKPSSDMGNFYLSHYFGVGSPGQKLPFHAGNPIYLPGQTVQPMSQLVGPQGSFTPGAATIPGGPLFSAIPISGLSTPQDVRQAIRGGMGVSPGIGPGDGITTSPSTSSISNSSVSVIGSTNVDVVDPHAFGGRIGYASGGQLPWEVQPFNITGGGALPGVIGSSNSMSAQIPSIQDAQPHPTAMPSPPPQQPQQSLAGGIRDLSSLYGAGKKVYDWAKPSAANGVATGPPLDLSPPGLTGSAPSATGIPLPPVRPVSPTTAVGEQFLGSEASTPGLAAGTAAEGLGDAAVGGAGAAADGLASIGAGEAAAAASAETAGTAGLAAVGDAAAAGAAGAAGGAEGFLALLALLHTGGRVYADGGGVDGDVNRSPTVPETMDTLQAQQNQLIRGNRRAQMFPHGTPELSLPQGLARVVTQDGTFHYNPSKIGQDQILQASKDGRENDILDLGPFNKADVLARAKAGEKPLAVVERDPRGREVKAAAGTSGTAHHQLATFAKTRTPGNSIGVEDPRTVLAGRLNGQNKARTFDSGGSVDATENPYLSFLGLGSRTLPGGAKYDDGGGVDDDYNNDNDSDNLLGLTQRADQDGEVMEAGKTGNPWADWMGLTRKVANPLPGPTANNRVGEGFSAAAERPLQQPPPRDEPAPAQVASADGATPLPQSRPAESTPLPRPRPSATAIPLPRERPVFPTPEEVDETPHQRAAAAAGITGGDPAMARAVVADNPRGGGLFSNLFGGKSPVANTLVTRMKQEGYSDPAIAAALAAVKRESNFNPRGSGDSGTAFGLFQRRGDRITASDRNGDASGQIDHFLHELNTSEGKAGDMLRNAKTPEEANAAMAMYERYKGYNDPKSSEYRARLTTTNSFMDPDRMSYADIMNRDNFQGYQRKSVGSMASDPDFWMRALVNIGASDFTHGTGPMLFQGLSKTIGDYDQYSKDNLTTQEKGQELAGKLKINSDHYNKLTLDQSQRIDIARGNQDIAQKRLDQTRYQSQNVVDQEGKVRTAIFDPKSGKYLDPMTKEEINVAQKAGTTGSGTSVFETKRKAFLALHPDDPAGALEYASGRKSLSPIEIRRQAIIAAQRDATHEMVPPPKMAEYVNRRAAEYEKAMIGGFGAGQTAPPAAGKANSTPETATPDPGEGQRVKGQWYIGPSGKPQQWQG